MKILHIITGLGMGGAEKVVVDLCSKSRENPYYQFYIASLTSELDRKPDLEKLSIPVVSLDIRKNGFNFIKSIFIIRKLLKTQDIDIVHAHMFHAYLLTTFACIGMPIPVVFTGHSTNLGSNLREYFIWATKAIRNYDIIFDDNQRKFYHKMGIRTQILHNGINVNDFKNQQNEIEKEKLFTFLNVGNLEEEKNQLELITIAKILKEQGRKFQIKIVGEGSKHEDIKKSIEKNKLENHIYLLGKRTDVPKLMAASHCYILPSLWEGMPITVLEAGVTGIPIIASPVGNIPQILGNERGFVAETSEFPEKMMWVMQNYQESLKRADKLSKYIQAEFSLNTTFQNHIELYHKILGR